MVSYLIIAGILLTIIVSGLSFNVVSDFVDACLSATSNVYSQDSRFAMGVDEQYTGDLLLTLFKFILVPSFFAILYFAYVMSQKPVQPY